jgi:hypothetical protein
MRAVAGDTGADAPGLARAVSNRQEALRALKLLVAAR